VDNEEINEINRMMNWASILPPIDFTSLCFSGTRSVPEISNMASCLSQSNALPRGNFDQFLLEM
jgi:hypothetical protein